MRMTPTLALLSSLAIKCASEPPKIVSFIECSIFDSTSCLRDNSVAITSALWAVMTSGILPCAKVKTHACQSEIRCGTQVYIITYVADLFNPVA